MPLSLATAPIPLKTDEDGVVRVGGTRVTLDSVVYAFNDGATAEEIAYRYPSLDLVDIYATIAYYLQSRPAVDEYLLRRDDEARAVRQDNESRFDPAGLRERLLARKHA
jgi:uncharacterized protein (DUF433 family)